MVLTGLVGLGMLVSACATTPDRAGPAAAPPAVGVIDPAATPALQPAGAEGAPVEEVADGADLTAPDVAGDADARVVAAATVPAKPKTIRDAGTYKVDKFKLSSFWCRNCESKVDGSLFGRYVESRDRKSTYAEHRKEWLRHSALTLDADGSASWTVSQDYRGDVDWPSRVPATGTWERSMSGVKFRIERRLTDTALCSISVCWPSETSGVVRVTGESNPDGTIHLSYDRCDLYAACNGWNARGESVRLDARLVMAAPKR